MCQNYSLLTLFCFMNCIYEVKFQHATKPPRIWRSTCSWRRVFNLPEANQLLKYMPEAVPALNANANMCKKDAQEYYFLFAHNQKKHKLSTWNTLRGNTDLKYLKNSINISSKSNNNVYNGKTSTDENYMLVGKQTSVTSIQPLLQLLFVVERAINKSFQTA